MMTILSPARNVRPAEAAAPLTRPLFATEAGELAVFLRELAPWQLESLLDVPARRALELYEAYRAFEPAKPGSPALLAYYGAAFRNMSPEDFTRDDLDFARGHLRVLSALYGILRPLDGIVEHRLGLTKEFRPGGRTLYEFWGDKVYRALYEEDGAEVVVNLASLDYAKLIEPYRRAGDAMVTCRFLVDKPGGPRGTVATVRAARGLMARYIMKNRVDVPEGLKGFDEDGYAFVRGISTDAAYVFVKDRLG